MVVPKIFHASLDVYAFSDVAFLICYHITAQVVFPICALPNLFFSSFDEYVLEFFYLEKHKSSDEIRKFKSHFCYGLACSSSCNVLKQPNRSSIPRGSGFETPRGADS